VPYSRRVSPFDRLDRVLPGDLLRPRSADAVRTRSARTAEARPNAPQLMRIVRHPYPLVPGRPARRVMYTPTSLERTRLFTVRPSRWPHLPDEGA
jgi:hypothetical protein